MLPDIRHLHRARNAALHEGLAPDREQLPVWASASQTYVFSLVDAVFGVDLRRLQLADTVENEELRTYLIEAAEALAGGQVAASAQASARVFHLALELWEKTHATRHRRDPFASLHAFDRASHDALARDLRALESTVAASMFSVDAAEAAWFLDTLAEDKDVLDEDDAERMIAFGFNWVSAFEAAARTWVPDRRHRHAAAQRRVREAAEPARIGSVVALEQGSDGTFSLTVGLVDVPSDDVYDEWRLAVLTLLREDRSPPEAATPRWWDVRTDGTVAVNVARADLEPAITALQDALAAADDRLAQFRSAGEHRSKEAERRALEYAQQLEAVLPALPEWVLGVSLELDAPRSLEESAARVEVRDDVASLRFTGDGPQETRGINDLIRNHPLVEQCYYSGTGATVMEPALEPQQLLDVLASVDQEVQIGLTEARRTAEDRAAALQEADQALRRLLAADH